MEQSSPPQTVAESQIVSILRGIAAPPDRRLAGVGGIRPLRSEAQL
jgi:hypothetical protein